MAVSVNEIRHADWDDEKGRQAEDDAHHLAHAYAISKDPERNRKAVAAAKRLKLETQANADAASDYAEGMNETALDRLAGRIAGRNQNQQ